MNNNSSAEFFPVFAAIPLAKTLFDIVASEDDVLEVSRLVLRQTKNAAVKTFILRAVPIIDCHLALPSHVHEIKGVFLAQGSQLHVNAVPMSTLFSIGHEDNLAPENATAVQLDTQAMAHVALTMEDELELRNINKYQTIDFNFHGDELSFRQPAGLVNVIYTVKNINCDGVEEVPEAVIEAIAYYLNFVDVQKRFLRGLVPEVMMVYAVKQKDNKIAQARMGGRISDNARKQILDVLHSFDRHQLGRAGLAKR